MRADNVRTLTPAGWDALVAYGIRRVVDLRLQHELDADGAGEAPVEVVHVSVLGDFDGDTLAFYDAKLDEATDAASYLAWSYGDFLERYHAQLRAGRRGGRRRARRAASSCTAWAARTGPG